MADPTREQIESLIDAFERDGIAALPDWMAQMSQSDEVEWEIALCRMALRALDTGWQPMSTAPRDGTAVLVTTSTVDESDRRIMVIGCVHSDDYEDEDDCLTDADGMPTDDEPLAWMPLPPPFTGDPATLTEQAKGVEFSVPLDVLIHKQPTGMGGPACARCGGDGQIEKHDYLYPCPDCNGTGRAKGGEHGE